MVWLLLCVGAASTIPCQAAPLTAAGMAPAAVLTTTPLVWAHGSHCDWRVGRDARVGYSHQHMHVEACEEANKADKTDKADKTERPLESYDRHDKKTSTRKTAGERERERRRSSPEDKTAGGARDERKGDDRKSDDAGPERRQTDQKDDKEAALAPRAEERPERPRCRTKERRPTEECQDDAPPPPYRRRADEGPRDEDADGIERARCGMLCMWRRAKYGHCGVGCAYYRRRYEGDGRDDWRRGGGEDSSDDKDRDRLK